MQLTAWNTVWEIIESEPRRCATAKELTIIISNSETAMLYASKVLNSRFELGEAAIAMDAQFSYSYAERILNGRFELGEAAIATDPQFAYYYAKYVLNNKFELADELLNNHSTWGQYYRLIN